MLVEARDLFAVGIVENRRSRLWDGWSAHAVVAVGAKKRLASDGGDTTVIAGGVVHRRVRVGAMQVAMDRALATTVEYSIDGQRCEAVCLGQ